MNNYPIVIDNFLSDEESDMFCSFLDPLVQVNIHREGIFCAMGWGTSLEASQVGYTRDALNGFENTPDQEKVDAVGKMLISVKAALEEHFGQEMDTVNFNYQQVHTGGWNPLHSDNSTLDGKPLQDDGTPEEVEWSALLYLNNCNEDYEGGEIHFPNQEFTLSPKRGQLVFFPGNVDHPHGVHPVKSGIRKNFVFFFARKGNVSGDTEFFANG